MRAHALRRRARYRSVHRWLALLLGAWFVLVGASGALLVWRDELDRWLNPHLLHTNGSTNGSANSNTTTLDLDAIAERARELGIVERIRPPAAAGEVYRVQLRVINARVESGRVEAMFDPANGELLGTRSLERLGLSPPLALRTIYEFHRNILLGGQGTDLVGMAGFALMASAITGIVVAWPRKQRGWRGWRRLLQLNLHASATRIAYDLHRCTGVLIVPVLLLSTFTGVTLVYLQDVRSIVGWFSRVEPFPVIPWQASSEGTRMPLAAMAAKLQTAFPGHIVREVHVPARALSGVLFYLRAPHDAHRLGDTIAWMHPISGELLVERSARTRSAGEGFMHWLLPLHVGSAFGTTCLVTMAVGGTAPLLLVSTGLWVWWRKRRGERVARLRRSARRHSIRRAPAGDVEHRTG